MAWLNLTTIIIIIIIIMRSDQQMDLPVCMLI